MGVTVQALLDLPTSKPTQLSTVWHEPQFCIRPALVQDHLSTKPKPSSSLPGTRDPSGARTQWPHGSFGVDFCLTETGDKMSKCFCLFIWCQLPLTSLPSHFHSYAVPITGVILDVCFLRCWAKTCRRGTHDDESKTLKVCASFFLVTESASVSTDQVEVRKWQTHNSLFHWKGLGCLYWGTLLGTYTWVALLTC